MDRLLGVDQEKLAFLQGYVSCLKDTLDEVYKGEIA